MSFKPDTSGMLKGVQPVPGSYYGSQGTLGTMNSVVNNTLYVSPIDIGSAAIAAKIGAAVTTIGDAGSVIRLGIYTDNGRQTSPKTLLLEAGTIPGDIAANSEIAIHQPLSAGRYWLAFVAQAASVTTPTVRSIASVQNGLIGGETLSIFITNSLLGLHAGGIAGALPNTFPNVFATGTTPRVAIGF